VAVITATGGTPPTLAAKAATSTIPIIFAIADNPVKYGLVASLNRPDGNATGVNIINAELTTKRLELLRELVPAAARIAVLVNPSNQTTTETTLQDVQEASRHLGLQIHVFNASTSREIDAAFGSFGREGIDAVFVGPDIFFVGRRTQFITLAARYAVPATFPARDFPEGGGLMSYGADIASAWHQVGVYAGRILRGAKPMDLPVVQASKFELVINAQTARILGLTVPPSLLSVADEVIE
jgi:putative tryptophan/tyrosine transport system substrate-binding protein